MNPVFGDIQTLDGTINKPIYWDLVAEHNMLCHALMHTYVALIYLAYETAKSSYS